MHIDKKFYSYEAMVVEGTMQDIQARLNSINSDPKLSLVFVSNIVATSKGLGCLMQVKRLK